MYDLAAQAYDCVCEPAVRTACHVLTCMMTHMPQDVQARLMQHRACVGIIGRDQVTSDMPGFMHLKLSRGARDLFESSGCKCECCGLYVRIMGKSEIVCKGE